jgi:acyl-CoA reductase-like NAD-dependent aldehyde dehydrogenase
VGPLTLASQVRAVEEQVQDALAKGARAVTGFRREGDRVWPVVLRDANHTMTVMREETFGPVLPVMPFRSEDEAVALANDSPYGLNASVWTADLLRGARVARALEVGNCAVNDVLKNIGHPALPFGGVKESGFGRCRGPEGLLAFSRTESLLVHPGRPSDEVNWFPYTAERHGHLDGFLEFLYGEGSWGARLWKHRKTLRYFRRKVR